MSTTNRDFPTYNDWNWNFVHYTCQSIDDNVLKKNWIKEIWETFWIWSSEVLEVPEKLIKKKWLFARNWNEAQIIIESLLPRL